MRIKLHSRYEDADKQDANGYAADANEVEVKQRVGAEQGLVFGRLEGALAGQRRRRRQNLARLLAWRAEAPGCRRRGRRGRLLVGRQAGELARVSRSALAAKAIDAKQLLPSPVGRVSVGCRLDISQSVSQSVGGLVSPVVAPHVVPAAPSGRPRFSSALY